MTPSLEGWPTKAKGAPKTLFPRHSTQALKKYVVMLASCWSQTQDIAVAPVYLTDMLFSWLTAICYSAG